MHIELRNISYHLSLAGDHYYPPFKADLIIDHKLAAKVKSEGHGSATVYKPVGLTGKKLTEDAEIFCRRKDPITYPERSFYDHPEFTLQATLLTEIDRIFSKHLDGQEYVGYYERTERDMNFKLIWGRDTSAYSFYTFAIPLARLLANPAGPDIVSEALKRILPKLRPGVRFLNTNIPEEILQSAGLHADQYTKPLLPLKSQVKQKTSKRPGKRL